MSNNPPLNDPYNYNYTPQSQLAYQIPPANPYPPTYSTNNSNNGYDGFSTVPITSSNELHNEYMGDPLQPPPPQQPHSSSMDNSNMHYATSNDMTSTEEPPAPTHLTPEQITRQRFGWSSIGLFILSFLLVIGCILSTLIKALDIDGVKSIVSLVISSLLNLAVILVSLFGVVSSLLNKKGWEGWRYRTAVYNLIGLLVLCALETLYLVLTNVIVPLLGIAMFFIGMIFVVLFYVPCIAVAAYRLYLMRYIPGAIPEEDRNLISGSVSSVVKAGIGRLLSSRQQHQQPLHDSA